MDRARRDGPNRENTEESEAGMHGEGSSESESDEESGRESAGRVLVLCIGFIVESLQCALIR